MTVESDCRIIAAMDARSVARAVSLGGAALAVGIATSDGVARELDLDAFRLVNAAHGPAADAVFTGTTELGSIWAAAGAATALAALGRRRAATRGLAAAGAAWLLGQGAKKLFLRPRPYLDDPDGVRLLAHPPRATSWPSSHPMVLLAFLTAAGRELDVSRFGRLALGGLAGIVGVSRSYVGVHFPSDVVGGLLLGRAVGELVSSRTE